LIVALDVVRRFRQGAVAVHILHHAEEADVHGAWLTEELARHGHRLSPGTLYPLLHRLEDEGLLAGRDDVVDGRVLRRYRATPKGRKALAELRQVVAELAGEVAAFDRRATGRRASRRPT
jgi:DNA-binding PadR family transcriptional regulator